MALVTLRYDLRTPEFSDTPPAESYQACLDQAAWADEQGLDMVVLSEHHGVPDGFMPSPLTLAGAVAGRTKRISINISALLLPLYHPIRLAEDLATLDLVSGGRVSVVLGLGYRAGESEMVDVPRKERVARFEEYVEVLRQAWTGEPFEWQGQERLARPRPATQPHPMLMVGGSGEKAARRAARLRLPFMAALGEQKLQDAYEDECRKEGWDGGFCILPHGPGFVYVTDDPDKAWDEIAPYAMHEATTYASWQQPGQRSEVTAHVETLDELKASGVYRVVTPEECVGIANEFGSLVLHPLMGGMPPELGWRSLELFASKVLPKLR